MGNFMTYGIDMVSSKINLNNKIDLKNQNHKQKEEDICKEHQETIKDLNHLI
jgi:hypothetical protein